MTATMLHSPVLEVSGAPAPAIWTDALRAVHIDRAFGLMGRARLRFADRNFELSKANIFTVGTAVRISLPKSGTFAGSGELIDGDVTGIALEQRAGGQPELTVTVDDIAYKLTGNRRQTTYLTASYSQVVQRIASKAGLRVEIESDGVGNQEYLLQNGSDLDFVNSIAERIGFVWWVDKRVLKLHSPTRSSTTLTLTLGEDLTDFSVRASGLHPAGVTVNGWDRGQQQSIAGSNNPPRAGSDKQLVQAYTNGQDTNNLNTMPATVIDLSPANVNEAGAIAKALYGDWQSAAVVATGTCDADARIQPSVTVQIKHAGAAEGSYTVTAVEHIYDGSGLRTRFTAGPYRPNRLVDTLGSPPPDPGFTIGGLIVAQVTDVKDPDNNGRVKVKYATAPDTLQSPWCRVVSIGGGPKRGTVFQPEVGDEVLVGFELGDTRRPIVIGGLFSEKNGLPTAGSGIVGDAVDFRRITSRRNHMIEFGDGTAPADQHVLLVTGSGKHKMRLGEDRFDIEMASGKPLCIKAGSAKFEISASGDITIEGASVTIKSTSGPVKVESVSQMQLKANAQMSVEGAMLDVKAQGVGNVQASGPLTLKGATVAIN